MRASCNGHDKVVELLLIAGAKGDLRDKVINSVDFFRLIFVSLFHCYEQGLMKLFISLV